MSYWTDTRAGPGHLARSGWREPLPAGPAGWKDIVTWRTLRVAAGVVLPLARRGRQRARGVRDLRVAGRGAAVAQWPVALLIAVGLPLGPGDAALRAGFVLAGGLFQGIGAMIAWTVRRGDPERAALAASSRSLAACAAGLAAGRTGAAAGGRVSGRRPARDPNPLLSRAVRVTHGRLLEHAERLRVSLAALGVYTAGDPAAARFAVDAGRALALAGHLEATAESSPVSGPAPWPDPRPTIFRGGRPGGLPWPDSGGSRGPCGPVSVPPAGPGGTRCGSP
jgi:hypothetical protein